MKRFILIAVVVLAGCGLSRLGGLIEADRAENPQTFYVNVDEDGDGLPETVGVDRDADGQVDLDDDGKMIEVEGARGAIMAGKRADAGLVDLATAATYGFPGLGILVIALLKLKPVQRYMKYKVLFDGLVSSVDEARDGLEPDGDAVVKALLRRAEKKIPGLEDEVKKAKARNTEG